MLLAHPFKIFPDGRPVKSSLRLSDIPTKTIYLLKERNIVKLILA